MIRKTLDSVWIWIAWQSHPVGVLLVLLVRNLHSTTLPNPISHRVGSYILALALHCDSTPSPHFAALDFMGRIENLNPACSDFA